MDNNQTNQTAPVTESNTEAIVALVTGIVAIVFAFCGLVLNIVGIVCGVVALVFAIKGRKKTAKKGMATAGLVTGIIGLVLCPIFLSCNICARCAVNAVGDSLNGLQNQLENYDWEANGWTVTTEE